MKNQTTGHAKDFKKLGTLLKLEDKRNRLLFGCGLFMGLRGSELCSLKWKDLVGRTGTVDVFQPKTGKTREVALADALVPIISECYEGQPLDSYVFTGRRGQDGSKKLTVCGLNRIIRKEFEANGVEFTAGNSSHCIRKSFSRNYYESNGRSHEALLWLQKELGHSSIDITLRYISIDREEMARRVNNISYE